MSASINPLADPPGVIFRDLGGRVDRHFAAIALAILGAEHESPAMALGHLDAPAVFLRVLNGFLDVLVRMPWPHLPILFGGPRGDRSVRFRAYTH